MESRNNNLKLHRFEALNQFFCLEFAITPLLGNIAPDRENWQALKGKNLSPKQQEVLAQIETKVRGEG